MGTENENSITLCYNGKPLPMNRAALPEITVPADAPDPEATLPFRPMEFTMRFKTLKHWRCWGRKRFIKLMMGEGWPRNAAEDLAYLVRIFEIPYGKVWESHLRIKWTRVW